VKYVRLYGFNHRRTQAQFDVAWTELREAVPKRKGSVVLGVSDDKLLLDGVPVEVGQAERGFAQLLNAAGIASIQFSSDVTIEEFESLVRAFSLGGSKAQDFATEMKRLFPDDKGNIRINEVKFVVADPATANVTAAAQLAVQALSPEFKEWLNEPNKLVQLIAAADGGNRGASAPAPVPEHTEVTEKPEPAATVVPAEVPFTLSEQETIEALKLITKFGELGSARKPQPEMVGLELHRAEENIRKTVLSILDEVSTKREANSKAPVLMRAAEQLAIRYALERFQSGDLKVNAVHQLLEEMGKQMANLRKLLSLHEDKLAKAGMLVESHADLLDRMTRRLKQQLEEAPVVPFPPAA